MASVGPVQSKAPGLDALTPAHGPRLEVLDGLRAISILLIIVCHTLPLGPPSLGLYQLTGGIGMTLFFTLSGFLITQTLLRSQAVVPFLIRRIARIVPLAWLTAGIYLWLQGVGPAYYVATMGFVVNYATQYVTFLTSPYWSLCVEVHFYFGVALLVLALGRRGLSLIPLLALGFTGYRLYSGVYMSINTHLRVEQILAGSILALIYSGSWGGIAGSIGRFLQRTPLWIFTILLLAAHHPIGGRLAMLYPYTGTLFVGSCLFCTGRVRAVLSSRPLRYVAEISYALYLIHPLSRYGWFNSGSSIVKYMKRPVSYAVILLLSHLSTFYFEARFIAWGKQLTRRWERWQTSRQPSPSSETAVTLVPPQA